MTTNDWIALYFTLFAITMVFMDTLGETLIFDNSWKREYKKLKEGMTISKVYEVLESHSQAMITEGDSVLLRWEGRKITSHGLEDVRLTVYTTNGIVEKIVTENLDRIERENK